MPASKQKLRKFYTAARKRIPAAEAERLCLRIAANILSLLRERDTELVLAYHRLGSEVDTAALVEVIMGAGQGVAMPYCRADGSMGIGRIFYPRHDLEKGAKGAMEPIGRLKDNVAAGQLDAVICPGVAFDKSGVRLGRGGGHYDRFLRELKGRALLIGCAFDCQISDAPLPQEGHDVAMDAVITEKSAFPVGCCPALRVPEPQGEAEGKQGAGAQSC